MKTPDEIKKGLECCHVTACGECPYMTEEIECREIFADALAHIRQLETENHQLLTENKQLKRERDAAVADIPRACGYCKWFEINLGCNRTECHNPNGCRNISGINTGWEWRGVKEE